jgi:hypothetical protein
MPEFLGWCKNVLDSLRVDFKLVSVGPFKGKYIVFNCTQGVIALRGDKPSLEARAHRG